MMYPLLLIGELTAICVGTHTENIKVKVAASTILILLGIVAIWFTISQMFA